MSLLDVLPELRAFSEDNMPDTCAVHLPGALVELEGGGWTTGAPTVVTVACRLRSVRDPDEIEMAGKLQEEGLEVLTVPMDTAISAEAVVEHTSGRDASVTIFNIAGVVPLGTFAVHRKVLVKRAVS